MQFPFIDTDGSHRLGVKLLCATCKQEFISRKNRKYCCRQCFVDKPKALIELECATCHKKIYRTLSKLDHSKSGLYFCNRLCKEKAQSLVGGIKEIMPPHYGTAMESYRDKFTLEELYCHRCGYKEFDCSVQIHHIDENRNNNCKSNLIPLCSCCHIGLHNNRWKL